MRRLLLIFSLAFFAGCGSDDNSITTECTADVPTLTGTYKISKVEQVTNNVKTDVTGVFNTMDPCKAQGVYELKADGTVKYTDPENCDEDNTGVWTVKNGVVTFSYPSRNISYVSPVGDKCRTISIPIENGGTTSLIITIRKQ